MKIGVVVTWWGVNLCYDDYNELSSFTRQLLKKEGRDYGGNAVVIRSIRMCGNVIMESKRNGVKAVFQGGDDDLRYVLESCFNNSRQVLLAMSKEMAVHYKNELTSKKQVDYLINEICGIGLIQSKTKGIEVRLLIGN